MIDPAHPAIISDPPRPAASAGIGQMLISCRSLAEYRAMFALTEDDLRRRILDCPGGASSFTAEVAAAGGDATACDPIYATTAPDELAYLALAEVDRGNSYVRAHPDGFVWTFFADPDDHRTTRRAAAGMFAAHLTTGGDRYVPAALPELPFDDHAFDLVLCSHLLFSYADRLNLDFHHRAITELVRVARCEVRVYPLVAVGEDTTYPPLEQLLGDLDRDGIRAHTTEISYEFQRGARRMLVCTRV